MEHEYQIRAVDAADCSVDSASLAGLDFPAVPPLFAGALAAEDLDPAVDTGVEISWRMPHEWRDGELTGGRAFRIHRESELIDTMDAGITPLVGNCGANNAEYSCRVEAVELLDELGDGLVELVLGNRETQMAESVVGGLEGAGAGVAGGTRREPQAWEGVRLLG